MSEFSTSRWQAVLAAVLTGVLLPGAPVRGEPADVAPAGCARFYGGEDEGKLGRMCVLQQQDGDTVRFWVSNDYPFPVSLCFRPSFVNMTADAGFPLTRTFGPHSLTSVYLARKRETSPSCSWSNDWTWRMGPVAAAPPLEVRCRVPFGTSQVYPVVQGPNGAFSHQGSQAEAIDWAMPTGTPVLAARAGLVIFVRDRFRGRSTDPAYKARTNTITVLHDDATMAEYSHIDVHSALVRSGQRVAAGQPIARSGDVGYSTGEHLHFRVFILDENLDEVSVPIRLESGDAD